MQIHSMKYPSQFTTTETSQLSNRCCIQRSAHVEKHRKHQRVVKTCTNLYALCFLLLCLLEVSSTAAFNLAPISYQTISPFVGKIIVTQQGDQTNLLQTISSSIPNSSNLKLQSSGNDDNYVNDEYKTEEIQSMNDLIISLSHESNDDIRRKRVEAIFQEQLEANDTSTNSCQRFTTLFNIILIQIGDQVRNDAILKSNIKLNEEAIRRRIGMDGDATEDSVDEGSSSSNEKTPEQLRVWALVDMMIQSKTIVKKANGELGREGTFA